MVYSNIEAKEEEGGKEFDEHGPVLVVAPAPSDLIFPSTDRKRAISIDNVISDATAAKPTTIKVLRR